MQGSHADTQQIEMRQLGKTSLQMSIVGFGASPLGNVFHRTDPAEGTAAVRYAIERGINVFDVSPYYGLTMAETRLGEALDGYRDKVVLATKCGRYGAAEFDFSAKRITASVEESLGRLRTDYIDLLQAHDVEFADAAQIIAETVPAMRKLQEQGKVRYVGITGYSLANLVQISKEVEVDSILSYCRYDLMTTDMNDVLIPFASKKGTGVINASALHMGLLTDRGPADWHPAPRGVLNAGKRVVELCKAWGTDVAEVALRFCFENPHVATTLVGMSSVQEVTANVKALSGRNNPELMQQISEIVAPVYNYIWPSGREENYG